MKLYWRLLGFAKPIGKYAVPYFFYTLFYALFNTFNFVMIIPLLRTLFGAGEAVGHITTAPEFRLSVDYLTELLNYWLFSLYGENYGAVNVLVILAVFVTVSAFLSNMFRYLGQRTIENLRINTIRNMRNLVFDNIMGLNLGYFTSARKGDVMSRITNDIQTVRFCIVNTLQVAFREPFLIIGYIVAMVAISWELTLFAVIYLPLIALIIGGIVKKLRKPALIAQEKFGEITSVLDESLSGTKVIKAYTAEDFFRNKFKSLNHTYSEIWRKMMYRQQLASPMSEFMGIAAAAGLLIFGGALVLSGQSGLDGSGFIAYIAIFTQITRPMRAFTDAFANINQGIAAGGRVLELLDTKSNICSPEDGGIALGGLKEGIEFRNVHFHYDDDNREVIGGVSFTVRKGETVALVGSSGGGKSTLSDLIPRFYDVSEGEILIDGHNIKEYNITSLREAMGIVTQETVLFNDTIENNIRLGKFDATMEEIEAAARIANAHDFITESPEGYQTNIGDRGAKLSGGQRQRLSIARAVLKNPDVLILDEATSALDTESEKLVQEALDKLLAGRTSVVIAHRLSTIKNADRILVVDEGRIAEEGTHAELIERGGIYSKLVALQQVN
ncbi:MAG: ABC transporter ATP-binding protein [Tidjanibacter sp.]|nr:ABC transporter ATP-binding protein [Tidjanibacter sp.]